MKSGDADSNTGTGIFEELTIPRRSELYHLEPIGIGTHYVESLTGYAARLAQEHSVTPSTIMKRVIDMVPTFKDMPTNFGKVDRSLTGAGIGAFNFVKALEALTMRSDLAWSTMITWVNVLPHRSLIRTKRAWCPVCYATWQEGGEVVYDPLLWTLSAVTVCPLHNIFLSSSCPHCRAQPLHLAPRSQPGFCARCKGWLGNTLEASSSNRILESHEDVKWELWKAESTGKLLASAPNIITPTRDQVATSLRYCINKYGWGSWTRFASQFEVARGTLWQWLSAPTRPSFESVLRLTYRIGVPLLSFLCGSLETEEGPLTSEMGSTSISTINSIIETPLPHDEVKKIMLAAASSDQRQSLVTFARISGWDVSTLKRHFPDLCATILTRHADVYYKRLNVAKGLSTLRAALKETPPPSLSTVAQRIGCNTKPLRIHFPEITGDIVTRYKDSGPSSSWKGVEDRLKTVLSQDAPSSLAQTSRSIGILAPQLRKKFPGITSAIARRFEEHTLTQKEARKRQVRQEVWEAVVSLEAEGIYPSETRVAPRVNASRNKSEIGRTLREVKREIANNPNRHKHDRKP